MIILKLLASFLLFVCLYVGVLKANKNNHRQPAIAEYMAGFIFAFGALVGFYKLWW
jgi:hypothetical protein